MKFSYKVHLFIITGANRKSVRDFCGLDSGKGKLEVIEGELGWERRRIGVLMDKYSECDECLNKPEDYLATRWQQEECQDPNNL